METFKNEIKKFTFIIFCESHGIGEILDVVTDEIENYKDFMSTIHFSIIDKTIKKRVLYRYENNTLMIEIETTKEDYKEAKDFAFYYMK